MAVPKRRSVLVFGDDMRIFLAVVRSLGRAGHDVHAAPFDWHAPALTSKYVSKVHYLPRYSENPQNWLTNLLDLLVRHKFDLVIPCCDRAIIPLDVHRNEIQGTRIAIPAPETIDALFDKALTRGMAAELGVPVVTGERLSTSATADELITKFGLPMVLKPRRSFSREKLETWGRVWIVESAVKLKELLGTIDDREGYLVESYFPGEGVGVSVISNKGNIRLAFQHRRLREGWGGSSSYRISESLDPELLKACKMICEKTALTGVCMFEFRVDRANNRWILVETNARFWGSLSLPTSLGMDFPRHLLELLVEGIEPPWRSYAVGVRSRNALLDIHNLLASVRRLGWRATPQILVGTLSFAAQPLLWLLGWEKSDSFVKDDLRPALAECAATCKSLLTNARRSPSDWKRRRGDAALAR